MTERLMIAYALIAAIALFLAVVGLHLSRESRWRARQQRRADRAWRRGAAARRAAGPREIE